MILAINFEKLKYLFVFLYISIIVFRKFAA